MKEEKKTNKAEVIDRYLNKIIDQPTPVAEGESDNERPYKVIRGQFEVIEGKLNVTCTTENVTFEEVRDVFYMVQKHFEHQIAFQRQCPHFGKEGIISEQTIR